MNHIRKILPFLRPYWKLAAISMAFLIAQVFSDLSIPRLIQRIIDQGIAPHNMNVVITTSAIMLFFSLFSMVLAPVSKVLECGVTGTLGQPKITPVYIPFAKVLTAPLHPLRTVEEIFSPAPTNSP